MNDALSNFGIIVAIVISLFGLFVNLSRAQHQNLSDDGTYIKSLVETSELTSEARLKSELRANKLEARISELEKLLNGMAYRVTFVVHTGEIPRVEKISVERFPAGDSDLRGIIDIKGKK